MFFRKCTFIVRIDFFLHLCGQVKTSADNQDFMKSSKVWSPMSGGWKQQYEFESCSDVCFFWMIYPAASCERQWLTHILEKRSETSWGLISLRSGTEPPWSVRGLTGPVSLQAVQSLTKRIIVIKNKNIFHIQDIEHISWCASVKKNSDSSSTGTDILHNVVCKLICIEQKIVDNSQSWENLMRTFDRL